MTVRFEGKGGSKGGAHRAALASAALPRELPSFRTKRSVVRNLIIAMTGYANNYINYAKIIVRTIVETRLIASLRLLLHKPRRLFPNLQKIHAAWQVGNIYRCFGEL